jgi:hypothetical protein
MVAAVADQLDVEGFCEASGADVVTHKRGLA